MKDYSDIIFSIDDYTEFDDPEVQLFKDVADQLKLLLRAGYLAVVRADDVGVVVIEFQHDENKDAWGVSNPVWLSAEEREFIGGVNLFDEEDCETFTMDDIYDEEEDCEEESEKDCNDCPAKDFCDKANNEEVDKEVDKKEILKELKNLISNIEHGC